MAVNSVFGTAYYTGSLRSVLICGAGSTGPSLGWIWLTTSAWRIGVSITGDIEGLGKLCEKGCGVSLTGRLSPFMDKICSRIVFADGSSN